MSRILPLGLLLRPRQNDPQPLIIYHGRSCPDGFAAALAAWRFYQGQAEFLALEHGQVTELHELPNLPFPEIKALWRKLFNGETPTHNRQFLERQLAYKLQEVEFRKVDPGLLDRNNKKIASLIATGKLRKRDRDFHPTPGTLFTREYHGKVHQHLLIGEIITVGITFKLLKIKDVVEVVGLLHLFQRWKVMQHY
jgi:hypothetical protein